MKYVIRDMTYNKSGYAAGYCYLVKGLRNSGMIGGTNVTASTDLAAAMTFASEEEAINFAQANNLKNWEVVSI